MLCSSSSESEQWTLSDYDVERGLVRFHTLDRDQSQNVDGFAEAFMIFGLLLRWYRSHQKTALFCFFCAWPRPVLSSPQNHGRYYSVSDIDCILNVKKKRRKKKGWTVHLHSLPLQSRQHPNTVLTSQSSVSRSRPHSHTPHSSRKHTPLNFFNSLCRCEISCYGHVQIKVNVLILISSRRSWTKSVSVTISLREAVDHDVTPPCL